MIRCGVLGHRPAGAQLPSSMVLAAGPGSAQQTEWRQNEMDLTLLDSRWVVALVSTGIGALLTLVIQRIVNKRGLFTFVVRHNKVGESTDDAIFGTVRVTWNGNVINHLYLSTAELTNESLKDFDNVVVKVFTNDAHLLTERPELVGTTRIPQWTEQFANTLHVGSGETPTQEQTRLFHKQREYLLPTMNRGQVVRVAYLNAALTEHQPSLWVDIVHKGVKLRLRAPHNVFMGVPQPQAALVGSALGMVVLGAVILAIDTAWVASVICLVYGLTVLVPGAICIRSWRWLRELVGG